jgi:signal transduction histidine kinase
MPVTQVPTHPVVSDRIKSVLKACYYARTADDYAHQVVSTLAIATRSQHAVWMNWPLGAGPLAQTEDARVLTRLLCLCKQTPLLSNCVQQWSRIGSVAAAPILFRSSIAGVLAVANSARPYTPGDLDLLEEVGRTALVHHESMVRSAALGLTTPARSMADIVHDLRQPLGTLDACAYYLELILPESDARAREQLTEMRSQLDYAGRILDEGARGYALRSEEPVGDSGEEALPEPAERSLDFTNSAMSMVT